MDNATGSTSYALVSLPAEVFTIIIGQVDERDYETLLSLCFTNRFLGWEATKRLYRELGDEIPRTSFHRKLLHTLISRPELATMVRSYTSRNVARVPGYDEETLHTRFTAAQLRSLQESDSDDSDGRSFERVFEFAGQLVWVLLAKALPLMVNLKELIYGDRSGTGRASSALLVTGRFQLKKLDWLNRWDDTFFDFLKTQRNLKWLRVYPRELGDCVSRYSITRFTSGEILTTLTAVQEIVEAVLPYAPGVRNLGLHFSRQRATLSSTFKLGKEMARYMGQIRRLTFMRLLQWNDVKGLRFFLPLCEEDT